ncbi:MAG: DUF763 domain-containing protein [Nannocystaceae bacterium]|nr:DUF763 domain-containing protein [Nannocystaceae bacterium]
MGRSTGRADLPLHGGRVPQWLATRMSKLGRLITEAIVIDQGRDAFIRKLAHPFWFQSFGAVMGMDWHSSGITTSVMGALKRGLDPVKHELGIYVCGGRGKHSRKTPAELRAVGQWVGIDGDALSSVSRLVAKVDSAAVQDGFDLYLHSFVVAADGQWTVVQQGMNGARRQARRYHWLSSDLESFVDDPHVGVAGESRGMIVNLSDRRSAANRAAVLKAVARGPDLALAAIREVRRARTPRPQPEPGLLPHLQLPAHHDVRSGDVVMRRLHAALTAAAERGAEDFESLLLTPGVGARTVESLALVAEVIHGAPCRFTDPARFSYAHGGKDGHPFPVPLRVYDQTIGTLRAAVHAARIGNADKLAAMKRLDEHARRIEAVAKGASWDELVARERHRSHVYGGRTVKGPAKPPTGQRVLPGLES